MTSLQKEKKTKSVSDDTPLRKNKESLNFDGDPAWKSHLKTW